MIFFRGRSEMIFYMPHKPTKWGFKLHILADSDNGYCCDIYFDTGKNPEIPNKTHRNFVSRSLSLYGLLVYES